MYQTITSLTGRVDDKQVVLINNTTSEGIVMGISDIDNACFILISYLKAVTLTRVDIISYSIYSVDQQSGFIIKFKRS